MTTPNKQDSCEEIHIHIDKSVGMTMGKTKLTQLESGEWLATRPIGTLYGQEVNGECKGIGKTQAEALAALEKDQKELNESLWI